MKAPKQQAPSQAPDVSQLQTLKWGAVSSIENEKMWLHIAQTALYQVYVGQSAWQQDLLVVATPNEAVDAEGPVRIYAAKDHKPDTIILLPWNMIVQPGAGTKEPPKDAIPLIMTVCPEKEEKSSVTFWCKPRPVPKTLASSQDRAMTLVPFWALVAGSKAAESSSASLDDPHEHHCLVYQQITVDVPTPAGVLKGIKMKKQGKIQLTVPCMINKTQIATGSRLEIRGPMPDNWSNINST